MGNALHLPDCLSPELKRLAFQVGDMIWPAWSIKYGLSAIEEMRAYSLAVIGGNLVVKTVDGDTQTHYTTEQGDYVSTFDIKRRFWEGWQSFVERSCREATVVLTEFSPVYPIIDREPYTLGFMLLWEAKPVRPQWWKPR